MSQCTLKSNRPKTIVRLGNDTPLLLALTVDTGEVINLNEVANLSVAIVSARSGRAITPPWQVTPSGGLSIEFSANNQSIGIYGLRVQFDRLSEGFADGLQAYAWEDTNLIEVVPTSTALPSDAPNTISGVLGALMKGDKGDPGDPTELLDELSRQQSARMDEIATAQRESLTSIRARLSDEQRTTLEGLAGRLSREQAGQIAQQTERLSTEQASGLQTISDRLSSEQTQTLERQGQERATAQADALKALDEQVNHKHDKALEGLSGKVDEATQREVPKAVASQLPAALTAQLPSQLSESLPSIIGLDDQSRLTVGGQPIGQSLKGADGRDGRDGAEVRLDQGWIRPLVVNMRHSTLRGKSNTYPTMDEMQAGVLTNPDYLPELWPNSETLYVRRYTINRRAQHFYWDGLRAYNDGTSGRRVIMRIEVSGLQGQHIRLVWTEAQMAKIHELFFNSSGTRSIYVDITDIDDRLHFLTTPGSGGVGGVSMVAIYESLASDNPQLPRGTWAQRPKTPYIGQQYIATDMRRNGVGDLPMWYNGQMWIDYEGHDVTRRYLAEG